MRFGLNLKSDIMPLMIQHCLKLPAIMIALSLLASAAQPPRVPFLFEVNQGQAPSAVRYLARTKSYQVFLEDAATRVSMGGQTLTLSLQGAQRSRLLPEDALSLRTDYFVGKDSKSWHQDIKNFHSVRRAAIYPGIDQLYYGNPERLEYDFIVHPGASPAAIRLHITGGEKLRIDAKGRLIAKIGSAQFIQHAPIAYQKDPSGIRHPVAARWMLADARTARIQMALYDTSQDLIIDPEIEAVGVFGGPGKDEWVALVRSPSQQQLLAVGVTESLNYPGAVGRRGTDITVVQLDSVTLETLRIVYIGGSGTDKPLAASLYTSVVLRIVGQTDSRDFPIVNTSSGGNQSVPQPLYGGGLSDGFIVDLNISNSLFGRPTTPFVIFSTYFGGSDEDRATAVSGSMVVGETRSSDLPINSGTYSGGWDAFWVSINSYANFTPGGYIGGSGDERVRAIGFVNNLTLLAGSTTSPDLSVENAWQTRLNGPINGFIATIPYSTFTRK